MFNNVISLGSNCHVAWDLERMGYRCNSYPFDWVISNFCDVIRLIDTHFDGNLRPEMIKQDENEPNCFHDLGTGIDYYHDFFPDAVAVEEQCKAVILKYNRRIQRFYDSGKQKTLYIRVIRNHEDYKWIEENRTKIDDVIHQLNKESSIIYIVIGQKDWIIGNSLKIFVSDDLFHPILACDEVKREITGRVEIKWIKRLANLVYYYRKQIKKWFLRTIGR